MKNLRFFTWLLIGVGLHWLNAGCHSGPDDGTNPAGDCRIQRIVSTTKAETANGTAETGYDYDGAGRLARKTLTNTTTNAGGGGTNTTTIETYAYTPDSLLTTSTYATAQKAVNGAGKVYTFQRTTTKTYTYANGRLSGYTQTDIIFDSSITTNPQAKTSVTSGTYEYDATGQLVKENSGGATWTYRNGQAVAFKSYFPYVLENGLITKATFPGTNSSGNPLTLVQTFQYDAQRRLIKYQELLNDSLDRYDTQEWQMGKPASAALPRFKGHPVVQSPSGEAGILTKRSRFFVNHSQSNAVYPFSQETYTNQLNTQGYVTNTRLETVYFTNGQQPDVTTTTYTYTGCN